MATLDQFLKKITIKNYELKKKQINPIADPQTKSRKEKIWSNMDYTL